ncbi:MAG: ComEA family DNA-binding protein [Pseudoxanthomonas sp.]
MNTFRLLLRAALLAVLLVGPAHAAGGERVNINTADAATLDRVLDGVGPAKAEAIIQYRKANGAFRSADQLASVKGIGLATVERNRDRIVVAGAGPAAQTAQATAAKPAAKPAAQPVARPVAKPAASR